MKRTPEARSRALREADGYLGDPVEHRRGRTVRDWLGCIDLIMVDAEGRMLFIQTTTTDHLADRVRKVLAAPSLGRMFKAGAVEVHGWYNHRDEVRVVTVEQGLKPNTVLCTEHKETA